MSILLPQALKSCPNCYKSPNLVTLMRMPICPIQLKSKDYYWILSLVFSLRFGLLFSLVKSDLLFL